MTSTFRSNRPRKLENPPVVKNALSPQVAGMMEKGLLMRAEGQHWYDIAKKLKVIKEDGSPDTGLVYRIVIEGYEPKTNKTRQRLGWPPICPACHRRLSSPRHKKDLFSRSEKELRQMLENRVDPHYETEKSATS